MADPKDHNDVALDNNTRLTNSPVTKDEKLEDYMKRLDEEFQRQSAHISKMKEKWYLSHFKVDRHQKVVKEREVKYDSLSALLHQFPIVSNTTPLINIQYINISFDNQIKSIMEDIENMTHVLEKTHTCDFLSHELGTKITASNTSATNVASQSHPYCCGMSMNSLKDYGEATLAQNKNFDPIKPGITAVIDHGITTRHAGQWKMSQCRRTRRAVLCSRRRPSRPRAVRPSARCRTFEVSTRTGRKHDVPNC
jgi:hypothetical protein